MNQLYVLIIKKKPLTIILFISVLILLALIIWVKTDYFEEVINYRYDDSVVVRSGSEREKLIALTFDDGPHPRFTPEILDILYEYNAKATFFVLGKHVKLYPEVLQRLIDEGHEVGNHTFTHIDVTKSSYGKISKELDDTDNIIYSVIGVKPNIFRPPFGFLNNNTLHIVKERGHRIVLWTANQDPRDWNSPTADSIANHIIRNVGNGNIILLHDYVPEKNSQTVEALKIIIPELIKEGYRFVTISELLEMSDLR
ncbi:polysaccharide deacetylase family protein [Alkaliphilus transvaalensis]|uniref:polysaccharide deacetylase family protein n=1 Tax=Alkaliphilus transvaalensis TaxID=114628 RepID=UPI000688CB7C|nr:polysaccharide deacetylase family protein [Alkaliphilus transvaalensis]